MRRKEIESLWTTKEVAQRFNRSLSWVHKNARDQAILPKPLELGGHYYWKPEWIEAWIEKRRTRPDRRRRRLRIAS